MMLLLLSLLAPAETGADPQGAWPAVAAHQLPENDGLYLRWDPSRSWGTAKLVEVMAQVSERLAFELPHAQPLLIGDVSRRGGGALFGHVTHHMGIDADIGLFLHDQ